MIGQGRSIRCKHSDFFIRSNQHLNPWNLYETRHGYWNMHGSCHFFLEISEKPTGCGNCAHAFFFQFVGCQKKIIVDTGLSCKKSFDRKSGHCFESYRIGVGPAVDDISGNHRVVYVVNVENTNRKSGDILTFSHTDGNVIRMRV